MTGNLLGRFRRQGAAWARTFLCRQSLVALMRMLFMTLGRAGLQPRRPGAKA
jgi:hypothetical protein